MGSFKATYTADRTQYLFLNNSLRISVAGLDEKVKIMETQMYVQVEQLRDTNTLT